MENCSMISLVRLYGHSRYVKSVVFSPNGEFLASGSYDGTIGVWEISSGECIKILKGYSCIV